MKPFTFPRHFAVLALCAGLSATAFADTVTLKNGTVVTGTILSETADKVTIETKEKGITDTATYDKKTEVASIVKETPEDRAANALLAKLNPSKDNMTAPEYDKIIKTEIQPWLDKNKAGNKRKAMEDLLKLYNDELVKVKAGEIKLRGAWIGVDEKKWNEYNVNARKLRLKFEDLLKAKKYPEAYWAFAEMEVTGGMGVDFVPVVEQMKKAMPNVEAAVNNDILAQPDLLKQRTTLLASMTADQKKNEDLRIVGERKEVQLISAQQKKMKFRIVKWYPYDLKVIQDALNAVKKEVETLNKLNLQDITSANKRFEQGLKDLYTRSWLSAKSNFEAVAKVHPKDPVLKAKLDEATKGALAPPPKPGATPAPAAKPGTTPPAKPPGVK